MRHDDAKVIFRNPDGVVTYGDIVNTLLKVGADDCDILFVHSDVSFGVVEKGIKRKELKEILVDALLDTGVKTIMFPTFTFSFCNKEAYDVENSPTAMGMIPDYVRKREDAHRTDDPIMSVAILGDKTGFEKMSGSSSCGEGGIFHQLHTCGKKVLFLFFGTVVTKCFTYLHYVEEMKKVKYRYTKEFTGDVISQGEREQKKVQVYVRYKDVIATLPSGFSDDLEKNGIMKQEKLGNSSVSIVDERKSFEYIGNLIDNNPYVFSILPDGELVEEYTYGNVVTM